MGDSGEAAPRVGAPASSREGVVDVRGVHCALSLGIIVTGRRGGGDGSAVTIEMDG